MWAAGWGAKEGCHRAAQQCLLLFWLPSGWTLVFRVLFYPPHLWSITNYQLKSTAFCSYYFLAENAFYSLIASQFRLFYFLCSFKLLRDFSKHSYIFVNDGELTGIWYKFSPLFTANEKDIIHSRHSLIRITAIKATPFPLTGGILMLAANWGYCFSVLLHQVIFPFPQHMWIKHMLGEAQRNCFVLPSRSTCGSSPFVARPWLPEQLPLCKGRKDIGRPVGGLACKKVPRRYLGIEWYNIAERKKKKQNQGMRRRSANSVDEYKKLPTEWA